MRISYTECDRCKRKIEYGGTTPAATLRVGEQGVKDTLYDICGPCMDEFKRGFMKDHGKRAK